jgi:hypothetical protein
MTNTNLLTRSIGTLVALELDPKKAKSFTYPYLRGIFGGSDDNGILFGRIEDLGAYFKAKTAASSNEEAADLVEAHVDTVYIPWSAIVAIRLNM